MHLVGVADNFEGEVRIRRFDGAGLLFQLGFHFGIFTADDDGLGGMTQAGETVEHACRGADAERSTGDEEEGTLIVETGFGAKRGAVSFLTENRIDRNATDRDVTAG